MRIAKSAVVSLVVLLLALMLAAGCSCSSCPIHRMLFGSKHEQTPELTDTAPTGSEGPAGELPATPPPDGGSQ